MSNEAVPLLGARQFYGSPAADRDVAGFHVAHAVYEPFCDIPWHAHENAFFSFVIAGHSREDTGTTSYARAPSMLLFHPRRQNHANHWNAAGGSCLHVEIDGARLEELQRDGLALDAAAILDCGAAATLGHRLVSEFRRNDTASRFAVEGIVLEILSEVARDARALPSARLPAWLTKARALVEDHYAEGIGVSELAALLRVNPSHLAVAFRKAYGCTVGDLVRQNRIRDARERLASSADEIGVIALDCGFADQSHFSKVFRAVTGESPAQYRRSRRA